jgi:hypothetical protein
VNTALLIVNTVPVPRSTGNENSRASNQDTRLLLFSLNLRKVTMH